MILSLDYCDFYVRAIGVPYTLMHEGMATVLGNAMGIFVGMDNTPQKGYAGSVLRFQVKVDIMKPLRE